MRFQEPTKWELFLEGFHDILYAWDCYIAGDEWGYDEFWEALSSGWYDEYIYPYDDIFYGHIPSSERQLRLGMKKNSNLNIFRKSQLDENILPVLSRITLYD